MALQEYQMEGLGERSEQIKIAQDLIKTYMY